MSNIARQPTVQTSGVVGTIDKTGAEICAGRPLQIEFFEQRKLEIPFASRQQLWGLATGVVIIGEFFIWSFGLQEGYGSMVVSTILVSFLYWILAFSIAELTSAFPFSGGPGSLTGYIYALSFTSFSALTCVTLGDYTNILLGNAGKFGLQPLLWLIYYGILFAVTRKTSNLFKTASLLCVTAILILVVYLFIAFSHFGKSLNVLDAWNVSGVDGFAGTISWKGIARNIPYAMWWYLGLEGLSVAAEHSLDFVRDAPAALISSVGTLNMLAIFLLIFCPAVAPGVLGLQFTDHPIVTSICALFNIDEAGNGRFILYFLSLPSLLASLVAAFYCAYMHVYFLSRSGSVSLTLSITNANGVPNHAIGITMLIAYVMSLVVYAYTSAETGNSADVLLRITCFFATAAYILELAAYIKIRWSMPTLPRPFRSPFGIPGALVGIIISLIEVIGGLATEPVLHGTLWGISALLIACFVPYYKNVLRNIVVNSPEKLFIKQRLAEIYSQSVRDGKTGSSGAKPSTKPPTASGINQKGSISSMTPSGQGPAKNSKI